MMSSATSMPRKSGRNDLGGENFVDECALESDLQMSFPDDYVPSSSERMLLYRELTVWSATKTWRHSACA